MSEADDLVARLQARRNAPGLVDMQALRSDVARVSTAGLGLGQSDVVRRLAARRSGEGAGAVAQGDLVLAQPAFEAEAEPGPLGEAGPEPAPALPVVGGTPAAPFAMSGRSLPVARPVTVSGAPGIDASAPSPTASSTSGGVSSTEESAPASVTSSDVLPISAIAGGAAAEDPTPAAMPVATEATAAPAAMPAMTLARPSAAAQVVPGRPAGRSVPFETLASDTAMPMAASAAGSSAAAQPARLATAPGVPAADTANSGQGFDDLGDKIARDLRRRLAVEREREGRPRWTS